MLSGQCGESAVAQLFNFTSEGFALETTFISCDVADAVIQAGWTMVRILAGYSELFLHRGDVALVFAGGVVRSELQDDLILSRAGRDEMQLGAGEVGGIRDVREIDRRAVAPLDPRAAHGGVFADVGDVESGCHNERLVLCQIAPVRYLVVI